MEKIRSFYLGGKKYNKRDRGNRKEDERMITKEFLLCLEQILYGLNPHQNIEQLFWNFLIFYLNHLILLFKWKDVQ